MIVYDLKCGRDHVFEAWFGDAEAFADQQDRGLLSCPICDDAEIARLPSLLSIGGKAPVGAADIPASTPAPAAVEAETETASAPAPEESPTDVSPEKVKAALRTIAKAEAEAVANSDYVGPRFAEEARAMHYGEQDARPIYGETERHEAKALAEEGIKAAPLLFPPKKRADA
ncbi:MAG: DUF1178 family protein [Pseudomonadota bacterium]